MLNFTAPEAATLKVGAIHVRVTQIFANSLVGVNLPSRQEGPVEVEMKIRGLMMDPVTNMPVVILKDVGGDQVLPIWVGIYEANAIALEIEKVSTPRPMTHDLLKNLLIGLEAEVRKVVVNDLRDDTSSRSSGSRGRTDHLDRFPTVRCAGAGTTRRLPHLRRGSGAQDFPSGKRALRQGVERRDAQVAREPGRRRYGAVQDVVVQSLVIGR